jgi:[ribosomal protein S18]-alanine N-acetyltransferase
MNRLPIALVPARGDFGTRHKEDVCEGRSCGPTIREMTEEDIGSILEIEKKSFVAPWTKGMFKEALLSPISTSFVMEEEGRLLGYIMLYSVADEAHILNLATHPDRRRQGYISMLIRYTLDYCAKNGVSDFFLEVRESNHGAQNLYRKLGFEVIGRRKRYYTETNEDALVMQLSLR